MTSILDNNLGLENANADTSIDAGPEAVEVELRNIGYYDDSACVTIEGKALSALRRAIGPEPGTWQWACEQALDGGDMRRPGRLLSLHVDSSCKLVEDFTAGESRPAEITAQDIRATDWEMVE